MCSMYTVRKILIYIQKLPKYWTNERIKYYYKLQKYDNKKKIKIKLYSVILPSIPIFISQKRTTGAK